MSDDTAMLKVLLDDAYAEIEELHVEIERLTAMVQAGHVHEWRPVAGSTGSYVCPACWDAGVWWPDEREEGDHD